MNIFAKDLKQFIKLASVRNVGLSEYLNYDTSYLSKWVSGKSMPTKSNIEKICTKCAEYFLLDISEKDLMSICNYLNIDNLNKDFVKIEIKNRLLSSYENTCDNNEGSGEFEHFELLPAYVSDVLIDNFRKAYSKDKDLDIVFLSEMCSMKDKYSYYNTIKYLAGIDKTHSTNMAIGFSCKGLYEDLNNNIIMLLNMMIDSLKHNWEFFITDENIFTEVFIIKNHLILMNGYFNSSKYLFSSSNRSKKEADKMYYVYGIRLGAYFEDVIESQDTNMDLSAQYYITANLKQYSSKLTEFFAPDYILEKHIDCEHKIYNRYINMSRVYKNKIMLSVEGMLNFISNSEVEIFDKRVQLSEEEKIDYIDSMIEIIKYENVSVKLVSNIFSSKLYPNNNISYYISDSYCIVKSSNENEDIKSFSIVEDNFKLAMNKFFDDIWDDEYYIKTEDKDYIIRFLEIGKSKV